MAFTEQRVGRDGVTYYRGRYKRPDGKYGTVLGSDGRAVRYPTKRIALREAREAEHEANAAAGRGRWVAPEVERTTLRAFILGPGGTGVDEGWLAAQDLAASSEQSYGHYIKRILDTDFADDPIADIDGAAIDAWEKREKQRGAGSSAGTYRRVLHLILEDAVEQSLRTTNPAKKRRNRGRRAGRSTARGPERKITTALGLLLIAERAAILAGRDDEFVETVMTGYTGMRWGEGVGLEPEYVREESIQIEWQLYELDSGELVRCPPKDDSYRTIDSPRFLTRLLREQIARSPSPCACHGLRYVYRGRAGRGVERPSLATVARAASVSTGTVSNVLNRPDRVRAATRQRVEQAIADLGYAPGGAGGPEAAHWRRSGHAAWIWTPAVSGWYPKKAPRDARPVPLLAEPWPGVPARGRGAAARATASWAPIQTGMTRHGRRHAHRALMEQLGTPKVLMDERMGHADSSMSARYSHVTAPMRQALVAGLTELWETSLVARLAMWPTSPVPALERLLREREAARNSKIVSQPPPQRGRKAAGIAVTSAVP
ncbi:LacI family DNA-binding transcriptional regulator [Streptomyces sp. MP131-18]|uniref:LacI family DNA-binding transcriptional regulator n=1 Tax=Streptomyces sp. MP131-18 TaxID=1857892 RepID=UPI00097CA666|nr:LacI family DNA-binding transcriptional regulator [Streptomyces sp. MP131-18]ONK09508.1 lac repressor [Streptomyces sp. MP131-18]